MSLKSELATIYMVWYEDVWKCYVDVMSMSSGPVVIWNALPIIVSSQIYETYVPAQGNKQTNKLLGCMHWCHWLNVASACQAQQIFVLIKKLQVFSCDFPGYTLESRNDFCNVLQQKEIV